MKARHISKCHVAKQTNDYDLINQLLERCSSMTHAARCLAWVSRFIKRVRHNNLAPVGSSYLTTHEINNATELIIKATQYNYFIEDIQSLQTNGTVNSKSKLLNLTPFLDDKGILRVGGRLQNSSLSEKAKHPALLPHSSRLTELIVDQAHKQTLHGGARLTLAQTRQSYWIIGGTRYVKNLLRHCVTCHRYRTSKNEQIMGNLPAERVTPSRPFTHCGVDFTGHVDVKLNKGRGVKTCKGYIAIFLCLVTKAVQIELVSDLSTNTFLAALKRLCARRGTPKHMYSDNGTNFKGAARILNEEFLQYKTILSPEFFKAINNEQIEWHFNCPLWPTAAGVWEAAVKSMKYHLKRVLGEQKLDFEQFTTLLTQIEACMNSRPLCPLTENIEDLDVLTPGHFLTGTSMLSLPQECCNENQIDLRNKWKLTEQLHQHIWRRWSKEYLHQLQTKCKWLRPKPNISIGDLVLVKEDNLPPGKWAMARALELHPGSDGYVRVVTLKTQNNVLKRPITKLSPLPKTEMVDIPKNNETSQETLAKEQREAKRNSPSTKGVKLSNYVILLTLSLFTFITNIKAEPTSTFTTTPIKGNKPIYFDEIGHLQFIHDEWTMLVYYNLSTFWRGSTKINDYINNLDSLCKRMENQPCEPVILQLKHELQQLTAYNSLLLNQHLRKKRGYFNGVGNLARTLFGTLDEEFAMKYQDDIYKIQTNENYLLQLIKNQTSIVETENRIIKDNEEFMEKQFNILNNYVSRTNETLSKIIYKVELMSAMNQINAASLTASLILSNLKRTQELLLDTLMNIHNGHLDIHLITPKQLVHELHMITSRISTHLTLPVKNVEENIKDILKLIYVKARVTQSYLLLEVHIPLTSDDEYQLYRVLPLPMYQPNGDILTVLSTSTYIATNFRKDTYISIMQEDLNKCVKINEESIICNTNYPIINLHSTLAPCEAKLLGQQHNLHCATTKTQCSDSWTKLQKPNRWLYSCCTNCYARVICDQKIVSTNLDKVGFLDLSEGCVLQNTDTSIFAFNHFGNKLDLEPEVPDIPKVDMHYTEDMHFNFTVIETRTKLNQSKLHNEVDKFLQQQIEKERLPTTIVSSHDVHQFIVLYVLVGGTCIAAIYMLVRRCIRHKKNMTQTQTSPSTVNNPPQSPPQQSYTMQRNPVYATVAPKKPRRIFTEESD